MSTKGKSSPNLETSSSSSSDDGAIVGSPKKSKKSPPLTDEVLSGSVRSASYNIVFQISMRIFTFALNAFILRYVSHDILGICNVRLALLYSSVMFLSREPFRRACLRKKDSDSWPETINMIWLVVPNTVVWSVIFGYIWCYVLSLPGHPESVITVQYQWSVMVICLSLVVDAFTEVAYIIGSYFLFYKLRIFADTTLIAVRSLCLCLAVIYEPSCALMAYAVGTFCAVLCVFVIYYGYFYYYIVVSGKRELPFVSLMDFLPSVHMRKFPVELATLAFTFLKQGCLKQLLTEGERYLMTFFDLLSFQEQGLYDLVANLGSLAARFLFLPIEESAYMYFAKTIQKRHPLDKTEEMQTAQVLGHLVRLMLMIGLIMIVYSVPYSNTVLFLYGGSNLSESIVATKLLQANCVYICFMAVNGVTEAYTFATMSQEQMDKFNRKLVVFSGVFFVCTIFFTNVFGSIGFFMANSVNMALRIGQSMYIINKNNPFNFNPFEMWKLKKPVFASFGLALILINSLSFLFHMQRFLFVAIGLIIFGGNCLTIFIYEKDLLSFFIRMYRQKSAGKSD